MFGTELSTYWHMRLYIFEMKKHDNDKSTQSLRKSLKKLVATTTCCIIAKNLLVPNANLY